MNLDTTEFTTLPSAPTILAAPGWATSSTASGEDTAHDYESPVRVGFLADQTDENGAPIVRRCLVALSQIDYHVTERGRITGTERCPAVITIDAPDAWLRLPVAEAEVMHAVLGGLLARYRLAESPATVRPTQPGEDLPCLPGCDVDHAEQARTGLGSRECSSTIDVGAVKATSCDQDIYVQAVTRTDNAERYGYVLLPELPDEGLAEFEPAAARKLAALLVAAADRVDAVVAGGAR